jgi:hypothetical protein
MADTRSGECVVEVGDEICVSMYRQHIAALVMEMSYTEVRTSAVSGEKQGMNTGDNVKQVTKRGGESRLSSSGAAATVVGRDVVGRESGMHVCAEGAQPLAEFLISPGGA